MSANNEEIIMLPRTHITVNTQYLYNAERNIYHSCALLGYFTMSNGNFLPTFWDNLSFPSSGFRNPKEALLSQYGVDMWRSVGDEKFQ